MFNGVSKGDLIDPCPDVHALFIKYNRTLFEGKLDRAYVEWSKRMTLCAGLCTYGGHGTGCSIKLSGPLLKLRPVEDTINTLLHECIHAYLFLTKNNTDRDDHGPCFQYHMHRINKQLGTSITIYHSFHDEVDHFRTHWWECSNCKRIIKRSMNRAPAPRDVGYIPHLQSCGGNYVKVREPEKKRKPSKNGQPAGKRRKPESNTPNISSLLREKKNPAPQRRKEEQPIGYIEISD
eukprot:TRINITY_DN10231_c0_g1_i1.p1 TRINITY_DN10231_c0_g1~~TRINITY_DN10231_c0_g1_i1.p1  ORF type:complete len:235 (+),score=29.65 TRINITY_DN10231_c0_g1_i1:163-867(+)